MRRLLVSTLLAATVTFATASAAHAETPAETATTEFAAASDTSLADIEMALTETPAGAAILAGSVTPVHHAEANHRRLPTTGFPSGEVAAAAAALILAGSLMVRRAARELAVV